MSYEEDDMVTCDLESKPTIRGPMSRVGGVAIFLVFMTALLVVPMFAYAESIEVSYSSSANNADVTSDRFDKVSDLNKRIKDKGVGSHLWITLNDDVIASEGLDLPADKVVELNLNGFKIDRNLTKWKSKGYVIQVGNRTRLNITGGPHRADRKTLFHMWDKSGSISDQTQSGMGGVITGGCSTNTSGGIHALQSSTIVLDDVTIAGCRSAQLWGTDGYGGGFWAYGSGITLGMVDSSIRGCYAYNDGGGLCASYASFLLTMRNSHIDGNYAHRYGGGVALRAAGSIKAKGVSTVADNTSAEYGGGIYVGGKGSSVNGLTIKNNRAEKYYGGGLALYAGKVSLSDLAISGNMAAKGGGVFVNNGGSLSSCTITENSTHNNTAGNTGAGLFVNSSFSVGGDTVVKDNGAGSGNLVIAGSKTSFEAVEFSLSKKADVHVSFENTPTQTIAVAGEGNKGIDCVDSLFSDHDGYHFEFDASKRGIYFAEGAQKKKDPVPVTTIAASDAMTAQETGLTENGYPVLKGYIRYPSFENSDQDTASPFFYSDGFFDADPATYNPHLATCSLNMAMSGFYLNAGAKVDYTNKHAAARQFMASIGCQDQDIYINDFNAQKPGMASIGVTIAAKELKDKSGKGTGRYLIPVAVRGAGYEAEWASNVTLGDATNPATGTEAQGFGEAANEVMREVEYFLAARGLNKPSNVKNLTFWVAGYSRAGATANLTSKRLVEKYGHQAAIFGYTFEAPQGGTDLAQSRSGDEYYCIHNIINFTDLVPLVGPAAMGFRRYGVDHYVPGGDAGSASSEIAPANRAGRTGVDGVTTFYDNQRIETTHAGYGDARAKMLAQLPYVDPYLAFDDYFAAASVYFLPPGIKETALKNKKTLTEEQFIRDFLENALDWSVKDRNVYAEQLQPSLRDFLALVFAMSPETTENIISRASSIFSQLSYSEDFNIIRAIRRMDKDTNPALVSNVITSLYNGLKKTGAFDYLSPSEQIAVEKHFYPVAYIALKLLSSDYNTTCYDTTSLMMTGTIVYNLSRIMSNHVPEINLAWLRSYDSYYDNENCAYVLGAPTSVEAPMALARKAGPPATGKPEPIDAYTEGTAHADVVKLTADGQNDLCGSTHIDLGVKNIKGEAIYYKLTKDGESLVATPACANGYDIYRDGLNLDLSEKGSENATYVLTAYAVSFGRKSPEVTYTIKGYSDEHALVVINNPNATEQTFTTTEGSTRRIAAIIPRGKQFKTWKITNQDGTDVSTKVALGENEALTSRTIDLSMPTSGTPDFKLGYALRVEAVYEKPINSLALVIPNSEGSVDFSKLTCKGSSDDISLDTRPAAAQFAYADPTGKWITTNHGYKDTTYQWSITLNESDSSKLDRNVEITMEGASDIQKTYNDDGTLTITGKLVCGSATTSRPAKRIDVTIMCRDANTGKPLGGMDAPVTYAAVPGDGGLIGVTAPALDGGAVFCGWSIPEGSLLELADADPDSATHATTFRVANKSAGEYHLVALYKPLVTALRVDLKAPVAGEELSRTATVDFAFNTDLFVYDAVDEHTWSADVTWKPQGETTLAQADTAYEASFTLDTHGWRYEPIATDYLPVVVTGPDSDKPTFTTFNPANSQGRIDFNGAQTKNHTVWVYDTFEGDATQHAWQEGSIMEVVAQQDEGKVFDHWIITTMRDGQEVDVTKEVISDAYDLESDNPTAGHARLQIVMPEVGAGFSENYELTVRAAYRDKFNEVTVFIPEPGTKNSQVEGEYHYTTDFGGLFYRNDDTGTSLANRFAMLQFKLPNGDTLDSPDGDAGNATAKTGSLTWERVTSGDEVVGTTEVYKNTTYHVHAYIDASVARHINKNDATVTLQNGPRFTETTLQWDGAGGLTINATFVTDGETGSEAPAALETFEVTVDASDANDSERKQLGGVEVEGRMLEGDGDEMLSLSPAPLAGATFAGWEVPDGSGLELQKSARLDARVGLNAPLLEGQDTHDEVFAGSFKIVDASKPLEARALYMPLIKSVVVGLPAPEAGRDLPTVKDATVTTVLANEAFSPVSMVATNLEWKSADSDQREGGLEANSDSDSKADYGELYRAAIQLEKGQPEQQCAFVDALGVSYAPVQEQTSEDAADYTYMAYECENDVPPMTVHPYFKMPEEARLVTVQDPFDIFNVKYGTDVSSLLPGATDIVTTDPTIGTAPVEWSETRLSYDGGATETSIWLATGTVVLSDNLKNPDNVDLGVQMEIHVNPSEATTIYAEVPYATLESGEYPSDQSIQLGTLEEGGTVYYTTSPTGDGFKEYQGEFIELTPNTLCEDGYLAISAYTSVAGKEDSPTVAFVYALTSAIPVPEPEELVYNGDEQTGVWNYGGYTLTAASDGVTIDSDGDAVATMPGTYTVTAKLADDYSWDMGYDEQSHEPITSQEDQSISFTIEKEPITFATIDAIPDQAFTGEAVTPELVVHIGDTILKKGVDYDVAYENNINVGTATAIVTGKGAFTDTLAAEFKIVSITITYDANGGVGTMEPQQIGQAVETPLAPNAFTREGYNFNGWNEMSDGTGREYRESEPVTFKRSVTLYAQWARKKHVVAAYSRSVNSNASVAGVQIEPGATSFDEGSQVTVTAPAKQGWAFLGWYAADKIEDGLVSSYDNAQLSNNSSYTFTVDGRKSVVAVYEPTEGTDATVDIVSVNGASYTVALDGVADESIRQGGSIKVPMGTKLTITAADPERVVMWLNESGKVIGTGQTSLDYTVTSPTTISLVYSNGSNEQTQVKFHSPDGQVMLYRRYSADLADASAIEVASVPFKLGHAFVRWVFEGTQDEATQEAILAKVKSPAHNYAEISVCPEYLPSEEKATVTLLTQKLGEDPVATGTTEHQLGSIATLDSPELEGMVFESWSNATGEVLGYTSPLMLSAVGAQTITARYLPEGTEVKGNPVISITGFNRLAEVDGRHRIQCLMSRSVPSGYTLVEHGVLYGTELAGLSEDTFVYGSEGVRRFVYTGKELNGASNLANTVTSDDLTVYYRAYMVLKKNGSSTPLTYYSDIRKTSFDAIGA